MKIEKNFTKIEIFIRQYDIMHSRMGGVCHLANGKMLT
jgi:hypothetical protein